MGRRHRGDVRGRGDRGRARPDRLRRRAGRPGGADVAHPLRVDLGRLRDLAVGAVTVPVYETSIAEQVAGSCPTPARSRRRGDRKHAGAGRAGRASAPRPRCGASSPSGDEPGAVDRLVARRRRRAGAAVPSAAAVRADDLATMIYTSGTTGRPKGCVLTHRNLLAEVRSVAELFPQLLTVGGLGAAVPAARARVRQGDPVRRHATRARSSATPRTSPTCRRPAGVPADVPARRAAGVREGLQLRLPAAHATARARSSTPRPTTAIAWSRACDTGGPGSALRLQHALFDRLVFAKLRRGRRRPGGGGGVRRRAARRSARPLLPRRGPARLRGLRADRDRPPAPRSTPSTRCASAASGGRCPGTPCGSPRTARS